MMKKLVAILIIAAAVFAFLYWFRGVEPLKTCTTPYVDQAVDFIKAQVTAVQEMLGEYTAAAGGVIATAVAGIGAVIRNYFNKQKQNVIDQASNQIMSVESELTKALGMNQTLKVENSTLKARLEQLEDVEANMGKLQERVDELITENIQLTAERNQVQRDLQLKLNPKEPEKKVE